MKASLKHALFICAFAGATLAAWFDASAATNAPVRIDIRKFAFAPQEITIAPGSTVRWVNDDETPHTVAAEDSSFVSPGLDTQDGYEHAFDKEGDITYFCTVHPFMKGVLHVRRQ